MRVCPALLLSTQSDLSFSHTASLPYSPAALLPHHSFPLHPHTLDIPPPISLPIGSSLRCEYISFYWLQQLGITARDRKISMISH